MGNKSGTVIFYIFLFLAVLSGLIFILPLLLGNFSLYSMTVSFITIISLLLIVQSAFNISWMLYAWDDPQAVKDHRSPEKFTKPFYSFTALLPARHEEEVIGDTIKSIANLKYPQYMTEILVICRSDDEATIAAAQAVIKELKKSYIKLVIFDDEPINKPHGLNIGLQRASKDIVVIFDAEDEPHKDIYNVVNTILKKESVDVVQSGVQLMNFNSTWFSALNVLEYFFWFKSTLHFFAKAGLVPLGGNTVFFKRKLLKKVGGWDEKCLTEDADIGIRLSALGAKIRIVYDERHVTQEETPSTVGQLIKQRTRWNQGFLQVFLKGDWLKLPKLSQKLLAAYILAWPQPQSILLLYIPFSITSLIFIKLPVALAILSTVPAYMLLLQLIINNIGLYEFTRHYYLKYSVWTPFKITFAFFFYQAILGISAFRAVLRMVFGNFGWEKTTHVNAHRKQEKFEPAILETNRNL